MFACRHAGFSVLAIWGDSGTIAYQIPPILAGLTKEGKP